LNRPLSILLIGRIHRAEFREAVARLEQYGHVFTAADMAEAAELLAEGSPAADLIVLAQSFPGEMSARALDSLRRVAPLSRIVGLMGSWCEGEVRSGDPWPAAIRVYWHQWRDRCANELQRLCSHRQAAWALPATATEEERLLLDSLEPLPTGTGLVVVRSSAFDMADWLCDACRRQGYAVLWLDQRHLPRIEGAAAGLLDLPDAGEQDFAELQQFAAQLRPAPVLVLMHFPRTQDVRRAVQHGAAGVLSKPIQLEDLLGHLARVRTEPAK
jgi:DNA-binding NarL/FixJ family response regulator